MLDVCFWIASTIGRLLGTGSDTVWWTYVWGRCATVIRWCVEDSVVCSVEGTVVSLSDSVDEDSICLRVEVVTVTGFTDVSANNVVPVSFGVSEDSLCGGSWVTPEVNSPGIYDSICCSTF